MKIAIDQIRGNSGVDVWAESLFNGIIQQGHECTLNLRSPLYKFIPFPIISNKSFRPPDVIHSNSMDGYLVRDGCPLLVTEHHVVHDPVYNPYKALSQKIFHRWIYRSEQKTLNVAALVTCVSKYTLKQLELVFGYSDAKLVYNGIDTEVFRPFKVKETFEIIPKKKCVLFFSGNLSKRKGGDLLAPIMKILGDNFTLIIASGHTGKAISGQKNIINLGYLPKHKLGEIYNICDIFLSPTRLEGFGLSIAEAMACEKPVIATNCSAVPELIINEKGGFLCNMDNIREFADRISYLSQEQEERERMGRFNRERVIECFDINKMVKKYITLYRSL